MVNLIIKAKRHCLTFNQVGLLLLVGIIFTLLLIQPSFNGESVTPAKKGKEKLSARPTVKQTHTNALVRPDKSILMPPIESEIHVSPMKETTILKQQTGRSPTTPTSQSSLAVGNSTKFDASGKQNRNTNKNKTDSNFTHANATVHVTNDTVNAVESNKNSSSKQQKPHVFKLCKELNRFLLTQKQADSMCQDASVDSPNACLVIKIAHLNTDFQKGSLKTVSGEAVQIFTYSKAETISSGILSLGIWENDLVTSLMQELKAYPQAVFYDIGSNLGVFSLNAAQIGNKVIAVDANYHNALRLKKSVDANGVNNKVDVYWNAVSPKNNSLRMVIQKDCNIGGSAPVSKEDKVDETEYEPDNIEIRPILLDSVISKNQKDVVMKIDVEGHEWEVISTGVKLFTEMKVHVVMMEWMQPKEYKEKTVAFFTSRSYQPFKTDGKTKLEIKYSNQWPHDIMWKLTSNM